MVSNRVRLVLHYVVRLVELALLYGHFLGALFFASSHLAVLFAQHNEAYTLSPAAVASPLFVMLGCLVLCFTAVFVWEMRVQGQPRILPPSTFQRVARTALRWCIMIGIALSGAIFVCFAILSGRAAYYDPTEDSVAAATNILVSLFVLVQSVFCHGLWLRRIADFSVSAFATAPASVQHLLPNQGDRSEKLKRWIKIDAIARIIIAWTLGFSVVSLGVVYMRFLFTDWSNANWIPQLVVGLVVYVWISASLTWFWVGARRRELDIIDGAYQSGPRSRLVSVYFAVVFFAGFVLCAVCFATNLYRVVTTLQDSAVSLVKEEFDLLLVSWPAFAFYGALMLDTVLVHARNVHEEQSVCVRIPLPLSLGMEYNLVNTLTADSGLEYDVEF